MGNSVLRQQNLLKSNFSIAGLEQAQFKVLDTILKPRLHQFIELYKHFQRD